MDAKKETYCRLNPLNPGLKCLKQDECDRCGWNPKVLKKRHEENIKRYNKPTAE